MLLQQNTLIKTLKIQQIKVFHYAALSEGIMLYRLNFTQLTRTGGSAENRAGNSIKLGTWREGAKQNRDGIYAALALYHPSLICKNINLVYGSVHRLCSEATPAKRTHITCVHKPGRKNYWSKHMTRAKVVSMVPSRFCSTPISQWPGTIELQSPYLEGTMIWGLLFGQNLKPKQNGPKYHQKQLPN